MKIEDHWLKKEDDSEKLVISKSDNARHNIDPDYLIVHYTATDTASAAIDWFKAVPPNNPDRIAAHLVIDLDGTITQLIPFNRRANHAGYSNWDGLSGMNIHSIGIEVVNAGFLEKMADGSFRRRTGKDNSGNPTFKSYPASTASKIVKTKHKHKFWTDADNNYWFKFPQEQLDALYVVSKLLMNHYQLIQAIGHDDISPARKPDPGPAFPWDEFKTQVLGGTNDVGKIFKVNTTGTKFRTGPSTTFAEIKSLPKGFEVGLIETVGSWSKVYLVNTKGDVVAADGSSIKSIGYIHSSLLTLK
ncbi:MAG: N-acetylmuramoyl-L-alanine amidase [Spirosomataceae bacterium]